ncbi:hypothetical protein FB45DRAFT_285135 [Roridomyces roridus]|uniref:HNH nuclease domain-containing protein n=1 Tax=Roridomyces roridus TaxID=1738132 RepID=A0AAD7FX04_9AGAR|nr:hypothetical protein FB45DRAFT_285135 [Roridomyces roridus]
MAQHLPTTAHVRDVLHFDPDGLSMWHHVKLAEEIALQHQQPSAKYQNDLIGARVLGWLLVDLWKHQSGSLSLRAYKAVLDEIKIRLTPGEREQSKAVSGLGLIYGNLLMRTFRSDGGPLPPSADTPTPPFIDAKAKVVQEMHTPTKNSAARSHALLRDGAKCVITGKYDVGQYEDPRIAQLAMANDAGFAFVECAHIFPETAQIGGEEKQEYAANAMAILRMFGYPQSLTGGNVHRYENIMIMTRDAHKLYDKLKFWFEEVEGQLNTYTFGLAPGTSGVLKALKLKFPDKVTFSVDPNLVTRWADGKPLPALPSRELLALRAACSRVAHLSGVAEQYDQLLHDIEHTAVMAHDGASVDLLETRILQRLNTVSESSPPRQLGCIFPSPHHDLQFSSNTPTL